VNVPRIYNYLFEFYKGDFSQFHTCIYLLEFGFLPKTNLIHFEKSWIKKQGCFVSWAIIFCSHVGLAYLPEQFTSFYFSSNQKDIRKRPNVVILSPALACWEPKRGLDEGNRLRVLKFN
jgi:hypothetical protein